VAKDDDQPRDSKKVEPPRSGRPSRRSPPPVDRTTDPRLQQIRRNVILALCSDDELMEQLVLKGGNALDIVHRVGGRTSQDLDYSIPADFDDLEHTKQKLFTVLRQQFDRAGLVVFDEKLERRPLRGGEDRMSGYQLEFKLTTKVRRESAGSNLDRLRREATVVGPEQARRVEVQISKHEYCGAKQAAELDGFRLFVYTPAMIAIEKLRAICQQMDEYTKRAHPSARARDFYDIHTAITQANVNLGSDENLVHLRAAFAAKEVPLPLLSRIEAYRERHRADWPAVENSVRDGVPHDYDFYFDFVVGAVRKLDALGVVDVP
jgi:hypothetical protein